MTLTITLPQNSAVTESIAVALLPTANYVLDGAPSKSSDGLTRKAQYLLAGGPVTMRNYINVEASFFVSKADKEPRENIAVNGEFVIAVADSVTGLTTFKKIRAGYFINFPTDIELTAAQLQQVLANVYSTSYRTNAAGVQTLLTISNLMRGTSLFV